MSNRKRRLVRKLANLPVSQAERARRNKQRLIAETEQRMVGLHDLFEGFHSFASSMEGVMSTPYPTNPVTKEDIDNLVTAVAAASMVPAEYFMPAGVIEGVKVDQVFIDDPLKKQLEDDTCERRYNEQQVQDVENTTASAESSVEDRRCDGG